MKATALALAAACVVGAMASPPGQGPPHQPRPLQNGTNSTRGNGTHFLLHPRRPDGLHRNGTLGNHTKPRNATIDRPIQCPRNGTNSKNGTHANQTGSVLPPRHPQNGDKPPQGKQPNGTRGPQTSAPVTTASTSALAAGVQGASSGAVSVVVSLAAVLVVGVSAFLV